MQVIIIDSWENVNRGVRMLVVRVFYLWNIWNTWQFLFTLSLQRYFLVTKVTKSV